MTAKHEHDFSDHLEMIEVMKIGDVFLMNLVKRIQEVYLADQRTWIIGFSGGKDSTAILSLIYSAIKLLPKKDRRKHIYVVSSDTLVETPVVVDIIKSVLLDINKSASKDKLPLSAHPVYPKSDQTFWVNLLGRGYPAPRQKFRWCTERMKIDPVSDFIEEKVAEHGEVVMVLGARKEESASRAQVISNHEIKGSDLSRHTTLSNAYIYMPIKSWTTDNVWQYLLTAPNPWKKSNYTLFELYKDSSQGECPMVIDTSTPSCGNSRFGCWTCTVVTEDKAINGLIQSGEEWMQPLLDFRDQLFESTKPEKKNEYRNYKRRTGKVTYMRGAVNDDSGVQKKHIPGPYWMAKRQQWLRELLEIEKSLSEKGHSTELIRIEELQAIRQQWQRDPNEPDWADTLPRIYSEVYPDKEVDWLENDSGAFTEPDALLLEEIGQEYGIPAELVMNLIDIEIGSMGLAKRRGIISKLESMLSRDWGSLEEINAQNAKGANTEIWAEKLAELQKEYDRATV